MRPNGGLKEGVHSGRSHASASILVSVMVSLVVKQHCLCSAQSENVATLLPCPIVSVMAWPC